MSQRPLIFQLLKSRTQYWHDQLEKELEVLMSSLLTLGRYRNIIDSFSLAYSQLRTHNFSNQIDLFGKNPFKLDFIKREQEQLEIQGYFPKTFTSQVEVPIFKTPYHKMGMQYVIEGSTLGGKVISKHLKRLRLFPRSYQFQFFDCYGDQAMVHWKEFIAYIERKTVISHTIQIIQGADETFRYLLNVFKEQKLK